MEKGKFLAPTEINLPPKIRSFISSVTSIREYRRTLEKVLFGSLIRLRLGRICNLDDHFLESDPQFPREAVLQVLRVIRIILENCTNKHFYSSYEGWGGKEEGLGLIACALQDSSDASANELGCTLHFEFYATEPSDEPLLPLYKVPPSLRFPLLTRLRYARAFSSPASRQQYTCIRLYAFIVLVQACSDSDDLLFASSTVNQSLMSWLPYWSCEDVGSWRRLEFLGLVSLVALCQDRSRQPSGYWTAVTSGGHRGILSSLMQKAIDSIVSNSSKWSVLFAEALLSLVTILVSSSSGCSAMREAGPSPALPLLKDTDPQHLHLVSMAVHVLEAFMDYSNPAAALFRDLGGLDDTIARLNVEVSRVENGVKLPTVSSDLERRAKDFGGGGVFHLAATVMRILFTKIPPASLYWKQLAVKDRNALRCFQKYSISKTYVRALSGDTTDGSSGLDELMRHTSSCWARTWSGYYDLILKEIVKLGSVPEAISDPLLTVLELIVTHFVEKKGIEAVLQLFTLPALPLSVSVGQTLSVAFKNFSPQHSASLAQAASNTRVSELGTADADVLKDLLRAYKEVLWQISLCCDSKVDEKQNVEVELLKM
ncbi:E3 ubiquitin- protein ligase upl1 [Datura stramonium]|uniref:E3 ubiquitin- protein ligase upl1 n=1 Tax=Datura stramonium TaxID=4076 RepID=A0ABS8SB06_DATST|nr:E3 ubiquitin- protein ligase upl1 [Datura stramonium]